MPQCRKKVGFCESSHLDRIGFRVEGRFFLKLFMKTGLAVLSWESVHPALVLCGLGL